jgi:hypothetical protein
MKTKAKLQIYTASNDYFVTTITIGDKGYYIRCDRREDMTGRIPQLTQWTSTRRTLHDAVTRSTERGEYYAKIVSGYITINRADITRDRLRGESSVTVVSKAADYLASKLGWHFPTTLSL